MAQEASASRTVDIQSLSRSCNEILILAILSSGPHHGYQLALELEEKSGGTFRFKHGTLYPILHRLEQDGWIRGDWLEEETKRKRKQYVITDDGRRQLAAQGAAWREFFSSFFNVVEGGES